MTKMEYFVPIESDKIRYHQFQIFISIFGIGFILGGIHLILNNPIITVNGELEQANFSNSWPFTLVGLAAIGLVVFYSKKLSLATVSNKGIVLHNRKDLLINWEDIDFAEIKHFIFDHCIRIHTKNGQYFNIQADRPVGFRFNDVFQPGRAFLRTKMWEKINQALTLR